MQLAEGPEAARRTLRSGRTATKIRQARRGREVACWAHLGWSGLQRAPSYRAQSIATALFSSGHVRPWAGGHCGPGTRSPSTVTREQPRFTRPSRRIAALRIINSNAVRRLQLPLALLPCTASFVAEPAGLGAELPENPAAASAALEGFWKSDWLPSPVPPPLGGIGGVPGRLSAGKRPCMSPDFCRKMLCSISVPAVLPACAVSVFPSARASSPPPYISTCLATPSTPRFSPGSDDGNPTLDSERVSWLR